MICLPRPRRVLALNVRSQSFAFAVLEGPDKLIDWGGKSFRRGVNAAAIPAGKKLATLLAEYGPDVVLVKIVSYVPANAPVVRAVKSALRRSGHKKVRFVDPRAVRCFFKEAHGAHDKYDIAALIARRFPEIAWKLPPERAYHGESEDHRVLLFDVIAIALAHFEVRQPQPVSPVSGELVSAP